MLYDPALKVLCNEFTARLSERGITVYADFLSFSRCSAMTSSSIFFGRGR